MKTKTRTVTAALFTISLAATSAGHAQTPESVSLGIKLLGANWQGENESGQEYDASEGGQLGANAAYQRKRFYAAINVQGGIYKFNNDAPDPVAQNDTQITLTPADKVSIKRTELDLLAGYYIWPQVSLFLDIKAIRNKWNNENVDYAMEFTGLGIGSSAFLPLNEQWTLFGSVGVVPNGKVKQNIDGKQEEIGDGRSGALELGAVFNITPGDRINFGARFQGQTYKFDNGETQKHRLNGIFLGYNHVFFYGQP